MLTACGKQEDGKTKIVLTTGFSENEVFKIGSSSCDRSEIMVYLTNMQNQYEAVYGDQIWSRSINGETLEDKVIRQMDMEILQKAMQTLTEVQKERLHLYFFEGMTTREIAEKQHTNQNAVWKTIQGAVKKLKIFFD